MGLLGMLNPFMVHYLQFSKWPFKPEMAIFLLLEGDFDEFQDVLEDAELIRLDRTDISGLLTPNNPYHHVLLSDVAIF